MTKLQTLRDSCKVPRSVPQDIRAFTEWFIAYYKINGISDPMYVANVTARELKRGDGMGAFDPKWNSKPKDLNTRLMNLYKRLTCAYRTRITQSGREPARIRCAFDVFMVPVRGKYCSCCGAHTRGRQYWNQDTGYGLCDSCIDRHFDIVDRFNDCHGIVGIHIAVERV